MTDRNANRLGYKKTRVGWIPEEWECRPFGAIVTKAQYGLSVPTVPDGETPILGMTHIQGGRIVNVGLPRVSIDSAIRASYLVKGGDILFNRTNSLELVGKAAHVRRDMECVFASYLIRFQLRNSIACPSFVGQVLIFSRTVSCLQKLATPGASQANINPTVLQNTLALPLPPLPEQKKIAEILSTWDEAIEQTRALTTAAKRRKRSLMQQWLTGKQRLAGFGGKWPKKRLRSITERITESPSSTDGYPVLSITAGTGFVSQEEKFSKVIAGRHIEHYVLLKKGEFSYNKGNSSRFPQGCAYRLREYANGLVPDVFYSFQVNPDMVVPEFIEQFFLAGLHGEQLRRWVNTGVRNNGLLNLNAADFFNLLVPLPPLPEQCAIATVLTTADEEIKYLEAKCAALERQKKGLMQKLLTGEVRVRICGDTKK